MARCRWLERSKDGVISFNFLGFLWLLSSYTLFENYSKCLILVLEFWHFSPIFGLIKLTCLVTLFDSKVQVSKKPAEIHHILHFQGSFVLLKLTCLVALFDCKLQIFKNLLKQTIFGIFHELLTTQIITFQFSTLAFSINFSPIKIDMSGNTVWLQTSGFQKLTKTDHFWHFSWTFLLKM